MKNVCLLIFTIFFISKSFSQNAIINNNYITVNAGDTAIVNMISNNYDPDEGEYFIINNLIVKPGYLIQSSTKLTDSTIKIIFSNYFNGNAQIICNINEVRNGLILATHKDTLFITMQNAKWYDTLDVNNIRALYAASGLLFFDAITQRHHFESPKNSKRHCNFSSSLNFSGFDNNNQIRSSANTYVIKGDFSTGPIVKNPASTNLNRKYKRLWTITKEKIDSHIQNWNSPNYMIDEVIQNWPANGDTTNGEMFLMAPFKDLNNNNIYEPLSGEYPLIKGDKCIYYLFNDINEEQSLTGGLGLGVEIHAMAYAYNTPNNKAINNTQFVEYSLYNRSNINYNDFIINILDDFDIGYPYNEYVGCDTNLNLGYGYNALNFDEGDNGYLNYPPAIGVQFLTHELNAFVYDKFYTNSNDLKINNVLNGKFSNGNNIYYGGNGIFGNPNVTNQIVNKMYFGDIFDSTQWSEKWSNILLGDRRMFMSTTKIDNFAPNEKIKFDIAFIVAQDSSLNNFQNVNLLKQYAQTVKDFHKVIGKEEITKYENKIKIYPNPVNEKFYIDFGIDNENFNVYIYDINGKLMLSKKAIQNYSSFDVSNLKQGIYFIEIKNKKHENIEIKKIVKL